MGRQVLWKKMGVLVRVKERKMNILDAAYKVLSAERRPMSAEEVTRRIVDGGMWKPEIKTPCALYVSWGRAARMRRR